MTVLRSSLPCPPLSLRAFNQRRHCEPRAARRGNPGQHAPEQAAPGLPRRGFAAPRNDDL